MRQHSTVSLSLVWVGIMVVLSRHWLGDLRASLDGLITPASGAASPGPSSGGIAVPAGVAPGTQVHAPGGETYIVGSDGSLKHPEAPAPPALFGGVTSIGGKTYRSDINGNPVEIDDNGRPVVR